MSEMKLKSPNTLSPLRNSKLVANGKSKPPASSRKNGTRTSPAILSEEMPTSEAVNGKVTNGKVSNGNNGTANGVCIVAVPRPMRPPASTECFVIREVYENGLASEIFALQLDYALEAEVGVIVIEPSRLGCETAQWLGIGATLRRAALAFGTASALTGALGRDSSCFLCGVVAGSLATIYAVSWRPDPCSNYRVEGNSRNLQRLPLRDVTCTAPVVLVRRRRSYLRRGIYNTVAATTIAVCAWRLYRCYGIV